MLQDLLFLMMANCLSIQHNVKILTSLVRCVILELNPSILTVLLQLETLLSISLSLPPTMFVQDFLMLSLHFRYKLPENSFSQLKPMTACRKMAFFNTPITTHTQILLQAVHSWVPRTRIPALFRRRYFPRLLMSAT